MYSDTLAASTWLDNGDKVMTEYAVTLAAHATATRRVRAYVAGTAVVDSGTLTFPSGGTLDVWITAIRESSSVVRVRAELIVAGITLQPIVTYTRITGLTLTNTQIVKITGVAAGAGAAPGDITAVIGAGLFRKAA